jgi:phosphate-selective porin OprO/OprP
MKSACIALAVLAAGAPSYAQGDKKKADKPAVEFVCTDQPSFRAGIFRVDLRAKLQADFRTADQDLTHEGGVYETAQKRIGITGQITNRVQFEIERELGVKDAWRDVFVNVEIARAIEVRAGKFKMPFSYDRLTGPARLDFAYRSLLAQTIAPGRDIGVQVHGEVFRRVLRYQAGVFQHDGENARIHEPIFLVPGEPEPKAERSVAVRLTSDVLRHASGPRSLR